MTLDRISSEENAGREAGASATPGKSGASEYAEAHGFQEIKARPNII